MLSKVCGKCSKEKALTEFAKQKTGKLGRRSTCKECIKKSDKIYRESNKEKIQAYLHVTRDRRMVVQREWRERNRDYQVSYRETDRGKEVRRLADQRRLARKVNLPDTLTGEQLDKLIEYFKGCALTGDKDDIQFDHLIPLSSNVGGTVAGNIIPLRADLNQSKGNRNVFEWFDANQRRLSLSRDKFDRMIEYIAEINGMTVSEYRDYYEGCFEELSVISRSF